MLSLLTTLYLSQLKVAYFTFDDGPSAQTIEIMDVLDEYEVPGLFFVVGKTIDEMDGGEEVIKQIVSREHQVGLHSMTHNRYELYQQPQAGEHFAHEMICLQDKVYDLTQKETSVCRAPYSRMLYFTPLHYEALKESGIQYLDWNVDSRDWSNISADQIVKNIKSGISNLPNNEVVVLLFHETNETVKALPSVISYLESEGYQFACYDDVTNLQELIKYK